MLIQAVGLALLAALSPTAAAVSAVFLSKANPQRIVLIYLTGAIVMTAIMAAVVFALLQSGHLYRAAERQPRYDLRLGLGLGWPARVHDIAYLRSHGYVLTVAGLLIGGIVLTINGALGLTGVVR